MKTCRYVVLDPTGNLTALVLDPVLPEEEAFLTNELLKVSEQVAYLEKPALPGAAAAIRLTQEKLRAGSGEGSGLTVPEELRAKAEEQLARLRQLWSE